MEIYFFYPQCQLLSTYYFNIAFISVILCRIIHCSVLPPSRSHFLGFKSLGNISLTLQESVVLVILFICFH